ncbi:hypothetical protein [Flagellimonas myxillae]|uniref:hypothetical protein n=1 Tax=Flagellimonas myxillae TaxID=2942214 RepID=UPI00201F089B|nr:hypothetical protein [Muricauda myxillae]MCL6265858.1 hypothetical protein [Muricauda myxillae]
MKKHLVISIMLLTGLYSCGQRDSSKTGKAVVESEQKDSTKNGSEQRSPNHYLKGFIFKDTTYASSTGKGITIKNGFPKGGMIKPDGTQYSDASGRTYGFSVFWTLIINETTTPLELTINFPADSLAIFTPPDSYLKLFLPTDTLTYDKLPSFNYGLTEIKSYLDTNFNKATQLQKTIRPNEEHIFYIVALSYNAGGTPRAALILNEQDLFYRMSIAPHGSGTIPIGQLAFKN